MAKQTYTLKDGTKITSRRATALLDIYTDQPVKGIRLTPFNADWLTEHHFVNRGDLWFGKVLCTITERGIDALRELGLIVDENAELLAVKAPGDQPQPAPEVYTPADHIAQAVDVETQPAPKFKVGDRVRLTCLASGDCTGVITQVGARRVMLGQQYLVTYDDTKQSSEESECDLELIAQAETNLFASFPDNTLETALMDLSLANEEIARLTSENAALREMLVSIRKQAKESQDDWEYIVEPYSPDWTHGYKQIVTACDTALRKDNG